jgi:hypothetical protein
MTEVLGVREQHLHHPGAVDEIHDVGFGHGAADRAELPPDGKLFEMES